MKFINIILLSIFVTSTFAYHKRRSHKLKASQTKPNMIFDFPQAGSTLIEEAPHVKSFEDIQDTPNQSLSNAFNKTPKEYQGVFPEYPPNNGAKEGTRKKAVIEEGKNLFRYGGLGGAYLTDPCEDEEDLSLPLRGYYNNLHCFKVVKPFTVEYGQVAPWFKSKGGPNQYMTKDDSTGKGMNVCELLLHEYIVYDENCKCPGSLEKEVKPEKLQAQEILNKRIIHSANEFKSMITCNDKCEAFYKIVEIENKRRKDKN